MRRERATGASVDDVELYPTSRAHRRRRKKRSDALSRATVFPDDLADVLGRYRQLDAGKHFAVGLANDDLVGLIDERTSHQSDQLPKRGQLVGELRVVARPTVAVATSAPASTTVASPLSLSHQALFALAELAFFRRAWTVSEGCAPFDSQCATRAPSR